MKIPLCILTACLLLCGCSQSDSRIDQLERRVAQLEEQRKFDANVIAALEKYVEAQDDVNTARKDLAKEQFKLWQLKSSR